MSEYIEISEKELLVIEAVNSQTERMTSYARQMVAFRGFAHTAAMLAAVCLSKAGKELANDVIALSNYLAEVESWAADREADMIENLGCVSILNDKLQQAVSEAMEHNAAIAAGAQAAE